MNLFENFIPFIVSLLARYHGLSFRNDVKTFTYKELRVATRNFDAKRLIDEQSFDKLYKGYLEGSDHVVAIKQLCPNGVQRKIEFVIELVMLRILRHPNIINLIGCCSSGDRRLLVYEYMPLGSLYDHLHGLTLATEPLDWNTRMKISAEVAKGLVYLHHVASPPVIHRNLKPSNILLGEGYQAKISNFGFAKYDRVVKKKRVVTEVCGTCGYCAPEYAMNGELSVKADVYSFGVILLEIISGRKVFEVSDTKEREHIVAWAWPLFKDKRKFTQLIDPMLQGKYSMRAVSCALDLAFMCLQGQAASRPTMAEVAKALAFLTTRTYERHAYPAQKTRFGLNPT